MKFQENQFDEMDKLLFQYYQENKETPIDINEIFREASYKKKSSNTIQKVAMILIVFVIISSGAVFSRDISNWIYRIFNPSTTSRGVIEMAQNGYLYNVQMEYMKSNESELKIEYIMMDDFNLDIVFHLRTQQSLENICDVELPDLLITDENKNLIYCFNEAIYEKYCRENKIPLKEYILEDNATNKGYAIEMIEKNEKDITFICKMYSADYPESRKLCIQLNTLKFLTSCIPTDASEPITVTGKWNFELEIPAEMYNREVTRYTENKQERVEIPIIVREAIATNSEMCIAFTIEDTAEARKTFEEIQAKRYIDTILLHNEKGQSYEPMTLREGRIIYCI